MLACPHCGGVLVKDRSGDYFCPECAWRPAREVEENNGERKYIRMHRVRR